MKSARALEELDMATASQHGKIPQERLKELHALVKPKLPGTLVVSVCGQRGWTAAETENCLC